MGVTGSALSRGSPGLCCGPSSAFGVARTLSTCAAVSLCFRLARITAHFACVRRFVWTRAETWRSRSSLSALWRLFKLPLLEAIAAVARKSCGWGPKRPSFSAG